MMRAVLPVVAAGVADAEAAAGVAAAADNETRTKNKNQQMKSMNNMNLKKLTPAETRTILTPETNNLHELLKLTFLDLVRRKLLRIEERGDAKTTETYVTTGPAFYTEQTLPHEEVMLQVFRSAPTMELLMKAYLKAVKGRLKGGANKYRKLIFESGRLQPYFKTGFFYSLFGARVLNAEGVQMQRQLQEELEYNNRELIMLNNQNDSGGMQHLFGQLGGNAFLLPAFAVGMYSMMGAPLPETMNEQHFRQQQPQGTSDSGGSGCSSYTNDWGASFDSGCSSHHDGGSGGDSGCSGGDSGCSGCGGGCGGGD